MRINVNQQVAAAAQPAWDLTFTINGQDLKVKPLSIGDMETFGKMGGMSYADQLSLFASIFSPMPDFSGWSAEMLVTVTEAILQYVAARHARSRRALGGAVARAMSEAGIGLN
jgi:hypothetical protein